LIKLNELEIVYTVYTLTIESYANICIYWCLFRYFFIYRINVVVYIPALWSRWNNESFKMRKNDYTKYKSKIKIMIAKFNTHENTLNKYIHWLSVEIIGGKKVTFLWSVYVFIVLWSKIRIDKRTQVVFLFST